MNEKLFHNAPENAAVPAENVAPPTLLANLKKITEFALIIPLNAMRFLNRDLLAENVKYPYLVRADVL